MSSQYDDMFQRYAAKHDLDWQKLKDQVAKGENQPLDPRAVSSDGALGLCQIMPATFSEWAQKLHLDNPNAFNPEHSIAVQAAYMAWLAERTGEWVKALAAYNWGIGHLERMLAKLEDAGQWLDELPEETRSYIKRILGQ